MTDNRKGYAPELRESLLRRMLGPEAETAAALARETGISETTLWRWKTQARQQGQEGQPQPAAPEQRSPVEKMRLVMAAEGLEGQELGTFLRHEGIYLADLQRWKQQMLGGLSSSPAQHKELQRKLKQAEQQEKQTQRELRRKEAALAETAALLVLSKKARRLWGDEGEPTADSNDSTS